MTPQQSADAWNRENEVGRVVDVVRDNGETLRTVTRTHAFIQASGIAVIFVKDIRGYYLLDRVTPYNGVGDIPDADRAGGDAICPSCNKPLRDHPSDLEHLGKGGIPFLTKLCDGRSVKL